MEKSSPPAPSIAGAPPVYKPQQSISQAKLAPPVFRPQPPTTQAKLAPRVYRPQQSLSQAKLAPPVFRPQLSTTQAKLAPPAFRPQPSISQAKLAPPVFRPQLSATQAKLAPPVYRPHPSSSQPKPAPGEVRPDSAAIKPPAPFSTASRLPAHPATELPKLHRGLGSSLLNSRLQPVLAPRPANTVRGCVQRAVVAVQHRPGVGMAIDYGDEQWEVTRSAENDPNIAIKSTGGKKTKQSSIPWATSTFTIVRPNSEKDYDMRGRGVAGDPERQKALDMMKAWIKSDKDGWVPANVIPLNALALTDFAVSKTDASVNLACEWTTTWVQSGKSGRTWTLVIDMDRPLAESTQEPHVGWTLSAVSTKKGYEVRNQFGHVWVDDVPASRQG